MSENIPVAIEEIGQLVAEGIGVYINMGYWGLNVKRKIHTVVSVAPGPSYLTRNIMYFNYPSYLSRNYDVFLITTM